VTSSGRVRLWHDEEGWGVIDSAATPGGCWVHYSDVLVSGYRALDAGGAVEFTFEAVEQDGWPFRAVEVWPAGQEPARIEDCRPSPGYTSELTLTFDSDDQTRPS